MNKTAIKNFAVWARQKLISDITYKAGMLGITEDGIADKLPHSTSDLEFYDIGTKDYAEVSGKEIKQRNALVNAIRKREKDNGDYKSAFGYVVEEVAYTWFNRLIAIRFMEVNDYLPSGVRVLSSENKAKKEPDLVTAPFDTDLEFTSYEQDRIIQLKDENELDELFRMLFIKQCNQLHSVLPQLFETTDDDSELLLTISFTDSDGVLYHLVHDIDEDDFNVEKEGQVQIIGWLYQFYNTELKDDTFAQLKKKVKITKERIPAATQLFTPDWIVRYMVENSLGRLWLEGHPNAKLHDNWKYYLDEAPQERSVEEQLAALRAEYKTIKPEEIKVIDPCMGSGHILVYAFDVLMQIYLECGYIEREAVSLILQNNLFGLDIDDRAYQLAYFAVMMKARQYDRRFLTRGIQPNLYSIRESNGIQAMTVEYFHKNDPKLKADMESIIMEMQDAKEYGSILNITPVDFAGLYARFDEISNDFSIQRESVQNQLLPLVKCAEVLAQKYDVVVTNPPYMAISSLSPKLNTYINEHYTGGKTDLFSAFIERCIDFTLVNKFTAMITMQSWMFLTSFEPIRKKMLGYEISSMAHLGARGFDEISGEVVQTVAFSLRKSSLGGNYIGQYSRLIKGECEYEKEQDYCSKRNLFYNKSNNFKKIPQLLIAYWVSERTINCFGGETLASVFTTREGMATADNDRFLRLWHEVSICRITIGCLSSADGLSKKIKWVPYNKGGTARDWYGNNDYVVDWFDDGAQIRRNADPKTGRIRSHNYNGEYGFKAGLTWSAISSGDLSVRYCDAGFLFDSKGAKGFADKGCDIYWILAFLNSKVSMQFLQFISPTLDFKVGDIISLPYLESKEFECSVIDLSKKSVAISKDDWDSYENSWNFKRNPLV